MRNVSFFVVAVALSSSCAVTHAAVGPLPAGNAPLSERADAYDRWKPSPIASATPSGRFGMTLADGTLVEDPKDLASAVPPGSATLAHAARADDASDAATGFGIAGMAVMSTGLVLLAGTLVYSFATPNDGAPNGDVPLPVLVGSVGGAGLVLGSLACVVPMTGYVQVAVEEKSAAFASYERDLRARLKLKPSHKVISEQWAE